MPLLVLVVLVPVLPVELFELLLLLELLLLDELVLLEVLVEPVEEPLDVLVDDPLELDELPELPVELFDPQCLGLQ